MRQELAFGHTMIQRPALSTKKPESIPSDLTDALGLGCYLNF